MSVTVWAFTLMATTLISPQEVMKTAPGFLSVYVLPSTSSVAIATPFWL